MPRAIIWAVTSLRGSRDEGNSWKFDAGMPETIWNLASGLPGGIGGSGCVCGALAGGSMALGLFFGRKGPEDREVPRSLALSRELHDIFKAKHKVACCRVLIKKFVVGSARTQAELCEDHRRKWSWKQRK